MPPGDSGTIVYVESDIPGRQGIYPPFVPVDKNPDEDGIQGGFIGLQNNLYCQSIRTVRVDCDYEVQGADAGLSIPSDSFPITATLEGRQEGCGMSASSDEGGGTERVYQMFAQIFVVSPDILSFLAVNQNRLPELPYRLTAICRAVGVTQAGDVMVTNDVNYTVLFAETDECCSTGNPGPAGFQTGGGTGGTPLLDNSSSSSSSSS